METHKIKGLMGDGINVEFNNMFIDASCRKKRKGRKRRQEPGRNGRQERPRRRDGEQDRWPSVRREIFCTHRECER